MSERGGYPHIATRLFDTPLLIAQSKLDVVLGVLGGRLGFEGPAVEIEADTRARHEMHALAMAAQGLKRADAGYYRADGVAVIPIIGSTVQRGGYIGYSGMTSYDAIDTMLNAAGDDGEVSRVLLEVDSPGGEASGAFDQSDRIYRARSAGKPITAVASEMALSAGYLLAAAADEVIVARSGYVGSVGVVTAHVDVSSEMEQRGRAVSFVYAGQHKIDGHPYAALPDDVRARMQADVDRLYGLFVSSVAMYRDRDPQTIRDTQAAIFMGQLGVDRGLADRVGNFAETLAELRSLSRPARASGFNFSSQQPPEPAMSDPKQPPASPADSQALVAQAQAEGARTGATAERQRIQSILTHADADGRSSLAQHLAFTTDMSADSAVALMATTPKTETKADASSALAAAMQQMGTPRIGAGDPADDEKPREAVIDANAIYQRRNAGAQTRSVQ